ncbi:MAG: gamma carbonic anhydrase family protein [Hydrogenophilales bacterium 12-61-10]|nr:MAG: gamma carbonic anhydrase family protein [Hydrogenophilales bacterium 12-61-10]OYX32838.1 MAG: gamma carbonic anhydrase family protein [Hydrogenophilales bacterium 32-62-9]
MDLASVSAHHGIHPQLGPGAWVHPRATVIGEVTLGADASVWPGAVIRGDVNSIAIGDASNIQDGSVLHVSHRGEHNPAGGALVIGARVTVGHLVILHACTIEDECLIGMGSIVLDRAVIQKHVLLGAGSLVPEGKILESGYLYLGRPAKQVRALTDAEIAYFDYSARHYVALAQSYR